MGGMQLKVKRPDRGLQPPLLIGTNATDMTLRIE
jgi:hypothetical protein